MTFSALKHLPLILTLACTSILVSAPAMLFAKDAKSVSGDATMKELDTTKSKITWDGKKVTGQHHGSVQLKAGSVMVKSDEITGGTFTVDMNTITDADLTDDAYNKKLIGHLKSDDFFDVAKYPTTTFVVKTIIPKKGSKGETHEVTGDLTMKSETHSLTFPATLKKEGGKLVADGHVVVDRTKWNVRYGSGKFFTGLGDKAINDEFSLDLHLVTQ